jgi:hypothetical protein
VYLKFPPFSVFSEENPQEIRSESEEEIKALI